MVVQKTLASPEVIQTRFGKPWEEIARLVDKHTMAVQTWLSTRAPRVDHFDSQNIEANSTGMKASLFNLALGCNFSADTDESIVVAELAALKEFYISRQVPWSWWIGPFPQPATLFEQLPQQGFIDLYTSPGLPAMAVSLPVLSPALKPNIRVWPAETQADLAAASTIRHTAFHFPANTALTYFEDMAADWLAGQPAKLYLAAVDDGPPAALGILIMGVDIPGIYAMATLPEWGKQGLGKAIMAHMANTATEAGHTMLVLTAGDMGYGLYKKFGFEHIFNYKIWGAPKKK